MLTILLALVAAWALVDLFALLLRAAWRRSRLNFRIAPSIRGRDLLLLSRADTIVRSWRLPRFLSWRSASLRLT